MVSRQIQFDLHFSTNLLAALDEVRKLARFFLVFSWKLLETFPHQILWQFSIEQVKKCIVFFSSKIIVNRFWKIYSSLWINSDKVRALFPIHFNRKISTFFSLWGEIESIFRASSRNENCSQWLDLCLEILFRQESNDRELGKIVVKTQQRVRNFPRNSIVKSKARKALKNWKWTLIGFCLTGFFQHLPGISSE